MVVFVLLATGCASVDSADLRPVELTPEFRYTMERLGAGQGAAVIDGLLYIYGDADTGVIREYEPPEAGRPPRFTGREIRLTRGGVDVASHPTGLAHHPEHGTFLGDTVRRKGRILHIDWRRALADGTLDNAILNETEDDAAVQGARPEFVRYAGRWWVATSDYGGSDNQVRLMDPARLKSAARTSEPGVVVHRWKCGPWVQTLHWLDSRETLVLVQNQVEGLRWRLTFAGLTPNADLRRFRPVDLDEPTDELEGFVVLPGERFAVFITSGRRDNVWVGPIRLGHDAAGPTGAAALTSPIVP